MHYLESVMIGTAPLFILYVHVRILCLLDITTLDKISQAFLPYLQWRQQMPGNEAKFMCRM